MSGAATSAAGSGLGASRGDAVDVTHLQVGVVVLSGPNAKGYYRLKWTEPDGTRGDTSAGRDLDEATCKAHEIDSRVSRAAGPLATTVLASMLVLYLANGRSPYKDKKPWKGHQPRQVAQNMNRMLRQFMRHRAMDVDRALLDGMRARAGTPGMVRQNTTDLRAFLMWGYQNHYFTAEQAELLPARCAMPAPALVGTEMPRRRELVRQNGQHETYIKDQDAPSAAQVVELSRALGGLCPTWGALAAEFAANSGPRWGEQFGARIEHVHLDGCSQAPNAHVHVDWQVNSDRIAKVEDTWFIRPKGNKTRLIPVPEVSFTDFPLRRELCRRRQAAAAEQAAGTNPLGLLFPTRTGRLLWTSSFSKELLLPAMRTAGWPLLDWDEEWTWFDKTTQKAVVRSRTRTTAVLNWHTLRHRFARIQVDVNHMPDSELMAIGGWESIATVQTRYYRSGDDNMAKGLATANGEPLARSGQIDPPRGHARTPGSSATITLEQLLASQGMSAGAIAQMISLADLLADR